MLVSAILGAFVGAVLGLTGAGGGMLGVPALVVGMHLSMQQAAPMALIAVAFSAAVGAIEGLRRGLVRYKAAMLMAVSGMPVTYIGQLAAAHLSQSVLRLCFSLVMIFVAVRLLLQAKQGGNLQHLDPDALAKIDRVTGKFIWNGSTFFALSLTGALTGFMTGLLGVGGGFVIVPLLRKWTQASMQGIVATSLMVIALVGTGGVVSAILHGTHIDVMSALIFTAATATGMLIGRSAIHKFKPHWIQSSFAVVLLVVSTGLMLSAISAWK